jgi:cAMP response element-binding protein, invertebrate
MIDSDDSDLSDEDSPKKRRDLLTRRPSYRKILNDLGGGEMGRFHIGKIIVANKKNNFFFLLYQFCCVNLGGTILAQSVNPNEHPSLHSSGGTIVQYSGQDGNMVSYVPGERERVILIFFLSEVGVRRKFQLKSKISSKFNCYNI